MTKMLRTAVLDSLQQITNSDEDLEESMSIETKITDANNNSEMLQNLERKGSKEKRKKKNKPESSDDENDEDNDDDIDDTNILVDEDEARLEDLVFGAEKTIVENMAKNNQKKNKKASLKFNDFLSADKKTEIADAFKERKAVWEDDNDEEDK